MKISLTLFFYLMSILGCAITTPHENFKNFREQNIGKRYDEKYTDISWYPSLIEKKYTLVSGNTEYKFRGQGNCRYYYEVDKETEVIVRWRFEGSKEDCSVAP